jgi:hypothetical protein
MKRSLKVKLAIVLVAIMLFGHGITAFGDPSKPDVEVIPSGNGVIPTVYDTTQAPEIPGYSRERHESSQIGDHSLLGGKIIVSICGGVYKNSIAVNWVSTIPISYVFLGGGGVGTMFSYEPAAIEDTALYPHLTGPDKPHPFNQITFYYPEELAEPEPVYSSVTVTKLNNADDALMAGWVFTLFTKVANGEDAWEQVGEPKTTGENGQVSWNNLGPGDYRVEETMQDGWVVISPQGGFSEFTLKESEEHELTFFNEREPGVILGSISGMKFHDENSNGQLDEGEDGLPGWKIELYTDFDAVEPTLMQAFDKRLVGYEITDEDGEFEFTGLPLGRYYLREAMTTQQAEEYEQTTPEENWLTVDLTETSSEFSGVLFGNVRKEAPPEPVTYTLTVKYVLDGTGETLADPTYYTKNAGESATATAKSFSEYVLKDGQSDSVTYVLDSDKEHVFVYVEKTPSDPPGEDPPGEDPPGEDPPGEDPPGEDPPGEDPPGEDPPGEDPPGEDLPGEDPPGEDPPGEDPPGEDPPGEDLPVEEPPVEEPPAEEPPVEEPPVEEPEIEIDDEEIPLTALPTTGGVAPEILYGIGMLLTATGVVIKRRRKF